MKIKTKDGIAEPLPLSDIQINNRWLKVIGFTMFLFFIYLIWLTYYIISNNVVNNIIYELSQKSTGRYYHNMDYSKDKYIDYWNDMWAECEFGEKNYEAVRKEYSIK